MGLDRQEDTPDVRFRRDSKREVVLWMSPERQEGESEDTVLLNYVGTNDTGNTTIWVL